MSLAEKEFDLLIEKEKSLNLQKQIELEKNDIQLI